MDKLEQYTKEILALKRSAGTDFWLIGNRLNSIKDEELYLESYGTWSEFLQRGVDLSERSAQRLMRIAREVEKEAVADWGVNKLDLLLSVEEPVQREVLDIHSPTDTIQEIRETVRKLKYSQEPIQATNPQRNEELDYFLATEEHLRGAIAQMKVARSHLVGCKFKQSFTTYPRKEIISQLWEEFKVEVNNGNNI